MHQPTTIPLSERRDLTFAQRDALRPTHLAPVAEIEAAHEFRMPHGVTLRRGARVRVPAHIPFKIPNATAEALGLKLDNEQYSPGSEVIIWPTPDEVAADRARSARILATCEAAG